jgi:hypothetical protein
MRPARTRWLTAAALLLCGCATAPGPYQPTVSSAQDLAQPFDRERFARDAQNPVADLFMFPMKYEANPGYGPDDEVQSVFTLQPVVPFNLNENWNLITRTVFPFYYQPQVDDSHLFGTGETIFTTWFSPAKTEGFLWGVGPVLMVPTASNSQLGSREWGGGASLVALGVTERWVIGGLTNNVWSFESGDYNRFLIQPFASYEMGGGWYVVSAPIVTADWEAAAGDQWLVPIGAGLGRVVKPGLIPMDVSAHYYYNVEHPTQGPDWQLRLQLRLIFPKKQQPW